MAALAKAAGQRDVAALMAETLQEEKDTDQKLTQLAERELNPAAVGSGEEEEEEEEAPKPPRGQRGRRRASA
jgi:hypothetical protein